MPNTIKFIKNPPLFFHESTFIAANAAAITPQGIAAGKVIIPTGAN